MLTIRIVLFNGVFSALQMVYRPHAGPLVEVQVIRDDPVRVTEWALYLHGRCAIDRWVAPVLDCRGRAS